MDTYSIISTALVPVTGVATWLASTRKRRNDSLKDLQCTVNMLVDENKRLYRELTETRRELAAACSQISILEANQKQLLAENAKLAEMLKPAPKKKTKTTT